MDDGSRIVIETCRYRGVADVPVVVRSPLLSPLARSNMHQTCLFVLLNESLTHSILCRPFHAIHPLPALPGRPLIRLVVDLYMRVSLSRYCLPLLSCPSSPSLRPDRGQDSSQDPAYTCTRPGRSALLAGPLPESLCTATNRFLSDPHLSTCLCVIDGGCRNGRWGKKKGCVRRGWLIQQLGVDLSLGLGAKTREGSAEEAAGSPLPATYTDVTSALVVSVMDVKALSSQK